VQLGDVLQMLAWSCGQVDVLHPCRHTHDARSGPKMMWRTRKGGKGGGGGGSGEVSDCLSEHALDGRISGEWLRSEQQSIETNTADRDQPHPTRSSALATLSKVVAAAGAS
jgi:hypothetical protein